MIFDFLETIICYLGNDNNIYYWDIKRFVEYLSNIEFEITRNWLNTLLYWKKIIPPVTNISSIKIIKENIILLETEDNTFYKYFVDQEKCEKIDESSVIQTSKAQLIPENEVEKEYYDSENNIYIVKKNQEYNYQELNHEYDWEINKKYEIKKIKKKDGFVYLSMCKNKCFISYIILYKTCAIINKNLGKNFTVYRNDIFFIKSDGNIYCDFTDHPINSVPIKYDILI